MTNIRCPIDWSMKSLHIYYNVHIILLNDFLGVRRLLERLKEKTSLSSYLLSIASFVTLKYMPLVTCNVFDFINREIVIALENSSRLANARRLFICLEGGQKTEYNCL